MAQKLTKGPGVYRNEIDQSEVTTPVGTNVGAFVGKASQGPVNRRVRVSRDQELLQIFGEPSESLGYALYGGLEFLKESDSAYFVRATSGGFEQYSHVAFTTSGSSAYKTLTANSSSVLLASTGYEDGNKENDIKDINDYNFSGELFVIASIGPGLYGNNLAVSIITSAAGSVSAGFDWQNTYDTNPLTDANVTWKKVFKIQVYQKASNATTFNSVSGSPVETFYVSRQQITDDNGNNLYLQDVINGKSKYIYIKDNTSVASTVYPTDSGVVQLLSGTDNNVVGVSNISTAWTLFNDVEKVDANILVCTDPGDLNSSNYAIQQVVGNIASSRQDCISLSQVDGTSSTVTNANTIIANAGYGYNNPSYVGLYAGWGKVRDRFNDREMYLPLNIFAGAICARVDARGNVWDAVAGANNAVLPILGSNVVFNGTQIGLLRDANINSIKFVRGIGNFISTQRTAQRKNTKLSNIHTRRSLNFIEKTIEQSLYPFLFEPNNDGTRLRIRTIVEAFLGTVASGGGLNTDIDQGFAVVCDLTNNPSTSIQNGQLTLDIYLKPVDVIEFIIINTIITKNGVSFKELVS